MKRTLLLVVCVVLAAVPGCSFEDLTSTHHDGGGPFARKRGHLQNWDEPPPPLSAYRSPKDSNSGGSSWAGSVGGIGPIHVNPSLGNICPNVNVCPK